MCHGTVCLRLSPWPGWRCPRLAPINNTATTQFKTRMETLRLVHIMFNTVTLSGTNYLHLNHLCNKTSLTKNLQDQSSQDTPNHTWLAFEYIRTPIITKKECAEWHIFSLSSLHSVNSFCSLGQKIKLSFFRRTARERTSPQ